MKKERVFKTEYPSDYLVIEQDAKDPEIEYQTLFRRYGNAIMYCRRRNASGAACAIYAPIKFYPAKKEEEK